ncbi:MAG: PAS domain S-box protein, partial [Thermoanaerobaculia bacterium]
MARARVLVVEDEAIVAMDLKRALEGFGYTVPGIAISGSEALEIATSTRPDIVLMDIQLDGHMDGVEVAHRINDLLDVPIVFLTAYSNETTLQRAKTAHPYGFLLKPYQERELRGAVEVALYTHGIEKKLRRRESWLDAVLQGMVDGVVATDAAGFVVFMNPPAVALTGRTLDQARGLTLAKVMRLIDKDQNSIQLDATSVDGGIMGPVSAILLEPEGNQTPVEFTLTRMQDENRRPEGTVVVFRDLSVRLKLEQAEAVRRSEERLRALIDGGSDVIIVFDADLKIRFASPSIEQLTGYSAAETIGTGMLDYIVPEDHGVVMEAMKGTRQGSHERAAREYRARHRDGSVVIVETVSTDLLDHPLVQGIVVNARDVTDRKRIEAALCQSERDYRGLFENASDCILIFEPEDERVLEANNRACEVYGFGHSEFLGKSLKSLSENVERGRRQVDLTLSTDSVHQFETVHFRRDGSPLNLEITASVVDYQGIRAIYSIGRDVTERKRAEQALLRANRRLEILNTVWREIAAVRSPTQVVEAALARLIELLPCEFASVALADPSTGESTVFVAVGDDRLGPTAGVRLPLDGMEKCPLDAGQGVNHCPDLGADGSGCPLTRSRFDDAASACACAALQAGGVRKGDLLLVSRRPESFSDEDLEVAGEVAGVIGVALHQAHLRTK